MEQFFEFLDMCQSGDVIGVLNTIKCKKINIHALNDGALIKACEYNNFTVVKCIIDHTNSTEIISENRSNLALCVSCRTGNVEMVDFLLVNLCNISNKGINFALIEACKHGYLYIVEYLITKYQDIDIHFENDKALSEAVHNNQNQIVSFLFNKYDNFCGIVCYELFISTFHYDNIEMTDMIYENKKNKINFLDALTSCIGRDNLKILKFFLKKNIIVSQWYYSQMFMLECQSGNWESIEFLVKTYPDIDVYDDGTDMPYLLICQSNNTNCMKCFIDKFPQVNLSDWGYEIIDTICQNGNLKILKYLANRKLKIDQINAFFKFSCEYKKSNMIKFILDNLSYTNCQNEFMRIACHFNDLETIKMIEDNFQSITIYPVTIDEIFINKNLELLKIIGYHNIEYDESFQSLFKKTCQSGDLAMAKLIYFNLPKLNYHFSLGERALITNIDVLNWLDSGCVTLRDLTTKSSNSQL